LKEHFENYDFNKLNEILNENYTNTNILTNEDQNVILLIDENKNIWELIKRTDLTMDSLSKPEGIKPVIVDYSNSTNPNYINIQRDDNVSIKNSEIDVSKISEFNISALIKETDNDISGFV
jgi:hypothetical protein